MKEIYELIEEEPDRNTTDMLTRWVETDSEHRAMAYYLAIEQNDEKVWELIKRDLGKERLNYMDCEQRKKFNRRIINNIIDPLFFIWHGKVLKKAKNFCARLDI